MHPITLWLGITATVTIGTVVLGGGLALIIRAIGLEYLVVVRNLQYEALFLNWATAVTYGAARGARLGLVMATLMAGSAVVGRQRVPRYRETLAPSLASLVCIVLGAALGGTLAYVLSRLGAVALPPTIGRQVAHVYRVCCSYGLEYGAALGGLLGTVAIAGYVFRRRARPCVQE